LFQVGGDIVIDGGGPADCVSKPITRGQVSRSPFIKAGGFDPTGPNAQFYRDFFAERELLLPAGEWDIRATLNISVVDCREASERAEALVRLIVPP
jgi:hypothetical protein